MLLKCELKKRASQWFVLVFLILVIDGCSERHPEQTSDAISWPTPSGDVTGYNVWMKACSACHGSGLAGAPRMDDAEAWKPRMKQGVEILVSHAVKGYSGPSGLEMPAKGGEASLTDDEVKAAVHYMTETFELYEVKR